MYEGVDMKSFFGFKPRPQPGSQPGPQPTPQPAPQPGPQPAQQSRPKFDISKYYSPFLPDDTIRTLCDQVVSINIPKSPWFVSMIFIAVKVLALSALYGMWRKNRAGQMLIDRQIFLSNLSNSLKEDNDAIS